MGDSEIRTSLALTRFPFTKAIQSALLSFVAAIMPASLYAYRTSGDSVDEEAIEEIQVTGTRATVQSTINIKRNSTTMVDGLSATEISIRGLGPNSDLHRRGQGMPEINLDQSSLTDAFR